MQINRLFCKPICKPDAAGFTSTEVVYGVADPDVTGLPQYGVLP